jgi:hypothetical protein
LHLAEHREPDGAVPAVARRREAAG